MQNNIMNIPLSQLPIKQPQNPPTVVQQTQVSQNIVKEAKISQHVRPA